ncbi:MAG: hypothetical protein V8R40_00680 [Dysosmobacter sp.]
MTGKIIDFCVRFEIMHIEIQPSETEFVSVFQNDRSGGWRAFITCSSSARVSACIEKANQELKKMLLSTK